MSLRVWLPFNGTLDNQGLDQVTVTNNGATIDNNGKIGKCYSFDGNSSGININGNIISTLAQGDFSICFWVYNDDQGNRSIYIATIPSSSYAFAIQKTTGEGLRVYWQSSPDYYPTNFTVPVQEWCHITVVIKNNNCYCYRNGILITSREDGSFTPQKLTNTWLYGMLGRDLRTGATVLKGKMNDFRWYDHALSPFEIKQISQGLVLHYPLNRNGWGQENLITGYDTSFLSYPDGTVTLFNNQMNEGAQEIVSNIGGATKCLHLHSNGGNGRQYGTLSATSGKSYTISCDYYSTSSQAYPFRGELNGGDYSWVGSNAVAYTTPNKWVRLSFSYLNLTSSATIYYFMQCSQNTDCYIKNLKIEEGSIVTPWCPNSTDALATTMGLNDNIQYDTSGYGNNGIKNGTFNYDSDTPKYNVSTVFDGINNCIQIGNWYNLFQNSFTINVWFKKDEIGSKGYETLFGGASGFEMNTRNGGSQVLSLYMTSVRGGSAYSPFNLEQWYMVTMVNDNTNELYYVDGILVKTIEKKNMPNSNYYIGAWNTATQQNFKGQMSDFRIYATALSAEDIKSLYNNSAYIDNQGNIYGALYEEV